MRAKRTHKQNTYRQWIQTIQSEVDRLNSKESTASLSAAAGVYYDCYDGVDTESYTGSQPVHDKSLSNKLQLRSSLLRRGKPFSDIPVLIRETGRTHKRFIEDENGILSRGKHSWKRQSGPVTQVIKDGKEVKK